MNLIQQLVMKEDEGLVVLPNTSALFLGGYSGDSNNPAKYNSRDSHQHTTSIGVDVSIDDILHNDEFFKKHALDGKDVLDDVLGMFGGSGGGSSSAVEMESTKQIKLHQGSYGNQSNDGGGSLNFFMETLTTLLDRIDATFSSSQSTSKSPRNNQQKKQPRTPPSFALLSRLQMASTSVDDLMNLLDEWHALLEGSHMGYPPVNDSNNPAVGAATISIDGESTFGVYLRRLCLGMEEIPFEALARLWDALREFVRDEMKVQKKLEDDMNGHAGMDVDACEQYLGNESNWLPSSPQIERIVRRTCLENNLDSFVMHSDHDNDHNSGRHSMSNSTNNNSNQNQLSLSSPQIYHNLLQTHPECPSLHFLLYLSSLANGQRSEALESLHRYFDYAMIHERKERAERTLLMLQQSGAADGEGGLHGGLTRMASGMGGITGGMTGGVVNGAAVGGGGSGGMGGPGQQRGGNAADTAAKMFRESNVMQYAAILLAQTYHRFGYTRLSLQATEEAIRVAQQSGDEECVCFANGLLALISSSVGSGSGDGRGMGGRQSVYASVGGLNSSGHGQDYRPLSAASSTFQLGSNASSSPQEEEAMLERCRARASEHGLASLAAGASLELARRAAYRRPVGDEDGLRSSETVNEGRGSMSLAWLSIQGAGRMPVPGTAAGHHVRGVSQGVGTTSGVSAMGQTDIYNMTNSEASSILGRQNIAISGLWESTGHASLASLSSCAALYGSGASLVDDEMPSAAMDRVLSSFTNGPGLDVWTLDHRTSSSNEVLLLENHPPNDRNGESYAAILEKLLLMSQRQDNSKWASSALTSTLHEWSVRSYDLAMARGLRTLLANCAAFPTTGSSRSAMSAVEASIIFLNQTTHQCCQLEEYEKAKISARRACWLASRHNLLFHHGWNLLQLALIDLEASTASPSNSLSVERALQPLLECLSLTEQYSMDPLRAIALTAMSKVFLDMGRHQKARAMLQAAMPLVMQHGHVWFQGEAFLTLAKCCLAEDQNQQQRSILMHETALLELKKAAIHFTQIEDVHRLRQVYYLQARVCNSLPNARKKRDEAAKMFAKLSIEKRERVADPVMAIQSTKHHQKTKQWNVLNGVMIANSSELDCYLSTKRKR